MKHILAIFMGIAMITVALYASSPVLAYDALNEGCSGEAANSEICKTILVEGSNNPKDPLTGKDGIIYKIAYLISYLAGAIAVIIMIYAGFRFVISRGEADKIAKSRQTIFYALIGLFVIIIAAQLVAFVVGKFA